MALKKVIIEVVGWYGALAILAAYILLTLHVLVVNSVLYQSLNLTGALGIVVVALSKRDLQPALLNIIWLLVAILALAQIWL